VRDVSNQRSYYDRMSSDGRTRSRRTRLRLHLSRGTKFAVAFVVMILFLAVLGGVFSNSGADLTRPAHSASQTILAGIALTDQHKDTVMRCAVGVPCPIFPGPWPPHIPNDVKGIPWPGNGIYGDLDDCPHCSAYCAPASIAMIANYYSVGVPKNQQDDIYDNGKKSMGEIQADGIIQTHGVGMTDGSTGSAWEVQDAFNWSIGLHIQHNQSDGTLLTAAQMQSYLTRGHPILWLDHNGWPANLSNTAFSSSYRVDQGHAKVIAGYDDNDTVGTTVDDLCLIYDPWPEYNDMSILPSNATKGSGGTFDPYWLPLNDVNLSDIQDKYLVDTFPDIPEFTTVIIPIAGMILIAVAVGRLGSRRIPNE